MIDYRIVRLFFNRAYPGVDFNNVKIHLVPKGIKSVIFEEFFNKIPDEDRKIDLQTFCVMFRHDDYMHIGYIVFAYSDKYKRLIVQDDSYKLERIVQN